MKNIDIREYAKSKKVNLWEVSEELGYAHETAFSRALRHELTPEIKQKIFLFFQKIKPQNNKKQQSLKKKKPSPTPLAPAPPHKTPPTTNHKQNSTQPTGKQRA